MSTTPPLLVRPIASTEWEAWDGFVGSSPQGTLFHTSAWKETLRGTYGDEGLVLLGCFEGGRLVGGCTFLARRRLGILTAAMPLQTPYAGFLLPPRTGDKISDQSSREAEILSALGVALAERFGRENMICAPGLADPRALLQIGYSVTPRFTYHVNLSATEAELWNQLDGPVRRQIRKAERSELRHCSPDPDLAYRLFQETFEKRGQACPVKRSLFDAILTGAPLEPFRIVHAVASDDDLAAFVIELQFAGTSYYALASTASKALQTGVSSWLIWQILRAHAEARLGCGTFDLVGANIPSIARFKEGFNPQLVPLWQLKRASGPAGLLLECILRFSGRA